jgi:hypothetical protein
MLKYVGEVDVEGCGRLTVHGGLFGRCMVLCVEVSWVVMHMRGSLAVVMKLVVVMYV